MKKSSIFFVLSMALATLPQFACSDGDNNVNQSQEPGGSQQIGSGVQTRKISSELPRLDSAITDDQMKSFVKGQYDLNFDLIRKSKAQISNDNAMISTFSIQMALGMVWGGADGNTAAEMKKALNFDDNTHAALNKLDALIVSKNQKADDSQFGGWDAVEIKTSNNLYFSSERYTWKQDWLDLLAQNYGAGIEEINFGADTEGARKYINKVVSDDTHERIKELIPSGGLTADTQSVITNAIYFKAPWRDEIVSADDRMTFNLLDDNTVQVSYLMASEHYDYIAEDLYQAVSVPLRNNDFKVMFVLPESGKFENLENNLNGDLINHIFEQMNHDALVKLKMPSFSYNTALELSSPLSELGMRDAFAPAADFSKMTNEPNELLIDKVFHKTFIGLDKNGVEAAAATAVVAKDNAFHIEDNVVELNLDHPYYYVIYEDSTHTPLFVGRVMNPAVK